MVNTIRINASIRENSNSFVRHIQECSVEFVENLGCDFEIDSNHGILYLSMVYHFEDPTYIEKRLKEVEEKGDYERKILLIIIDNQKMKEQLKKQIKEELQIDDDENEYFKKEYNKQLYIIEKKMEQSLLNLELLCIKEWQCYLALDNKKGAQFIQALRKYRGKEAAQEIYNFQSIDVNEQKAEMLAVCGLSKPQATQLIKKFGSIQKLMKASRQQLEDVKKDCRIGAPTIEKFWQLFHEHQLQPVGPENKIRKKNENS